MFIANVDFGTLIRIYFQKEKFKPTIYILTHTAGLGKYFNHNTEKFKEQDG